jgi:hypothetical protein
MEKEQCGRSEIFIIYGIPVMEKEQRGRSEIFIIYGTANEKGVTGAFTVYSTSLLYAALWIRIR